MTFLRVRPSQGQKIVLDWNNTSTLKDWVSYVGSDGEPFQPPDDRSGYSDGVERRLPIGLVLMSGLPIVNLTFPWVTYGQIDYLMDTFDGQNVTVAIHKPSSIVKTDTFNYNAVCNIDINQTVNLTRRKNGYEAFIVELVLVEPL